MGRMRSRGDANGGEHGFNVAHHVDRVKAKHFQALLTQPSITTSIARRIVTYPMAVAVDFDVQPR